MRVKKIGFSLKTKPGRERYSPWMRSLFCLARGRGKGLSGSSKRRFARNAAKNCRFAGNGKKATSHKQTPAYLRKRKEENFFRSASKNIGLASFAAGENPFPPRKGRLLVFRLKPRRGKASFVKKTAGSFFHSARRRKNHKIPPLGKRRALLFKREKRTPALENFSFGQRKGRRNREKRRRKHGI